LIINAEEAMRRSSDSIFYNANEFEVLGLLDVLARGRSYREPVLNSADAVVLLAETGKDFSGTYTAASSQSRCQAGVARM
jgi:hypothetical protein